MRVGQARIGRAKKPVSKITRLEHRKRIHRRVRQRLQGTAERPRLSVFRSLKHIYAQISYGGNLAAAKAVGKALGERARQAGLARVVFDRNGYQYHGRVKALAEAAREAGLEF